MRELPRFNLHEDSDFAGFLSFVYLNENQLRAMSEDVASRACKALNRIQDACIDAVLDLAENEYGTSICKKLISGSIDYAQNKSMGILDFLFLDMCILELDNYDELVQRVEDNYKSIEEDAMSIVEKLRNGRKQNSD